MTRTQSKREKESEKHKILSLGGKDTDRARKS